MFWKKLLPNPVMFSYDLDDQRASFRVYPPDDAPMWVFFGEETVQIIEIGVGGFSFRNLDFDIGNTPHCMFSLPNDDVMISIRIEILHIDEQNVCGCTFVDLPNEAENAIHLYMLAVQKTELGKKKPTIFTSHTPQ